ncbi:MAG: energy transducer TonB [Steroidobacteraceae bacterium]
MHPKFGGDDAGMPGENAGTRTTAVRTVIALTNDPALQKALEELAAGDAAVSVVVVADMRALTDELMQQDSACALIDAAAVDAPIDAATDAITSQFPDLRLMVAGHSAEQNMLATRISNQSVFRFVHKPASSQRLRLFLDAAARPVERPMPRKAEPAKAGKESLARIDTAVRGKSPQTVAMIGVVAIVAVAVGAWIFWPSSKATPDAAPAVSAVNQDPAIADLIKRGMMAFAAGKYIASDGTSSAELYREALKLDKNNATATSGYNRAIEYALRTAEETLLAGRLNESSAIAESLRLIAPNNSRLEFLNTQISREMARANADASQRQALEARQAQVRTALDRMSDRIRVAALVDPSTNSAVSHFRQAEAAGPGDPAVRSARESLVAAMLTAADNELAARRTPAARRLLDAAASINSSAPGLDVLRRRLDEVNSPAATAAPVEQARAETPPAPASVTPATAPVTAPAAAASIGPVPASTLTVLRKTNPEYPERALQQLVSGWVDLEFTVNTDGSVKDVVVTQSEPGRTFDAAATKALLRYRYAPVLRNGEAVQQRAQMRMRFTARDSK